MLKRNIQASLLSPITGWGEHPEALATEADADLVLEKPFELSELDNHVTDMLAKKKK